MTITFNENEYTIQQVIKKLNKFYGGKSNGKKFDNHDISRYMRLGHLPALYGGNEIKWMRLHGLTAITVHDNESPKSFNKI